MFDKHHRVITQGRSEKQNTSILELTETLKKRLKIFIVNGAIAYLFFRRGNKTLFEMRDIWIDRQGLFVINAKIAPHLLYVSCAHSGNVDETYREDLTLQKGTQKFLL